MSETSNYISNRTLKNILSKVNITIECDTTGFEYEEDGQYLYSFINNNSLSLADVGCLINGKQREVSDDQKENILGKLLNHLNLNYDL